MDFIEFNSFSKTKVITSTRDGGYSFSKKELNFSYDIGDKKENVDKNYDLLYSEIGVGKDKLVILSPENCPYAPLIFSKSKEIAIGVLHSDSIPLFFESKSKVFFGAIQLVGKQLQLNDVSSLIKDLFKQEDLSPNDMYFYLAPSLDFLNNPIPLLKKRQYKENMSVAVKEINGKLYMDNNLLVVKALRKEKVPMKNIFISSYSTVNNNDLLFSKTLEKPTGKNISIIKYVKA